MRNTSIAGWLGACVVCIGASTATSASAQQDAADLILFDGKLFTGDAAHPTAEAVAIRGERIVALGTSKEIVALAGANTRRIDLHGRVVTPGFNDAHMHFG